MWSFGIFFVSGSLKKAFKNVNIMSRLFILFKDLNTSQNCEGKISLHFHTGTALLLYVEFLKDGRFVKWKEFSQGKVDVVSVIFYMHDSFRGSKSGQIKSKHQFVVLLCSVSARVGSTLCFHTVNPLTVKFVSKSYVINFYGHG